jgi:multidrug efflux pump subunit AcrA (membrane-fusion protein)
MKRGFGLAFVTLPLAAIGAGVLAFVVATSPPPAQEPVAERATPVRAIVAEVMPVMPMATGHGLVAPARSFEAIAQVGGDVVYVNPRLRKGEILSAGEVLVRLSPADYNLAIAQARANIRAAEAKLAEIAVSQENQAAALEIEQEVLALKRDDLERAESLFGSGSVSQAGLDAARNGVLAQRQKVLSIESTLALLPTQRDVQVEQIAVYQASLETAELNLARTELTLPFAARVASVAIEQGQYVRAGQTTAMLDGIEAAEVEAQISVEALRTLLHATHPDVAKFAADPTRMTEVLRELELTAELRLAIGAEVIRWAARVDRVSDTIDPKTGTLGVILRVDTPLSSALPGERPPLTKGMFVEVALSAEPVTGIVIDRAALRDGTVLVVGDDNRLARVEVVASFVQDGIAVIEQGLEAGQRVVVSDISPIMPGMLLEVTEDTGLISGLIADGQAQ